MGHVLNPVFVGLLSGFGEAVGGITIYLTGAGGGVIWSSLYSRLRTGKRMSFKKINKEQNNTTHNKNTHDSSGDSLVWSKGKAFYHRLSTWMGERGGSWVLFIVSALIISPYYFAALAAGSLHMGITRFFLISWSGKTVRGLTIAFGGFLGLGFLQQLIGS
jgi:hypothetical protein